LKRTTKMNEQTIRALVEAGAVKRIHIVAESSRFYVEVETPTGKVIASTLKGSIKTWSTLDATAKWVRKLGIGSTTLDIVKWQPSQRRLSI
jgi:hypothetical protein